MDGGNRRVPESCRATAAEHTAQALTTIFTYELKDLHVLADDRASRPMSMVLQLHEAGSGHST